MLGDGALGFHEFLVGEELPLATLHQAILEFLRDRTDAVLFGAYAVNAYAGEPRMTQDVDLLSTRAADLAEELRTLLSDRFHIALRVRGAASGGDFRVYQLRAAGNRHLADVRQVEGLPPSRRIESILVLEPLELIVRKVMALAARSGQPKAGTDWRDLAVLLLAFPAYQRDPSIVLARLAAEGAPEAARAAWRRLAAEELRPGTEES